MRPRAARLTPIQQTTSQENPPDMGQKIAYKAHRAGVAERFSAPAGHQRLAVDLALMRHDDSRLRDMELSVLTTAQPHHANPLSVLRTVPGIGEILRLVPRDAIHDIHRFPRGQDVVSYGRLVQCAKASAGNRDGTGGTTIGHASRTWAFSEAAVLLLRDHPPRRTYLTRVEKPHGTGKALTVLAHHWVRAVDDL
jgi:hypothetical protein